MAAWMQSGQSLPMSHLISNHRSDCPDGMSFNTKCEASPVMAANERFQICAAISKGRWRNFSIVCRSPKSVASMHFLPASNLG
jgi:hypothetical protein